MQIVNSKTHTKDLKSKRADMVCFSNLSLRIDTALMACELTEGNNE